MKRKTKIVLSSAVTLLVLVALYCALILPLNGSMIYKAIFTDRVRSYVTETYGEGFTVDHAGYDFKINGYLCHVKSNTSEDTHWTIYEGKDGELSDHYDFEVMQKENTIWRLTREMDIRMVQDFLPIYPRNCVNYMCFFEKEPLDRGTPEVRERFELDMPLDMKNLPLPLEMTLWVECDAPSWEALAESFRDAKEATDSLGWQVSFYSVSLYTPLMGEDGKPTSTATDYCAYQVPCEMIEDDTLADYLKSSVNQ